MFVSYLKLLALECHWARAGVREVACPSDPGSSGGGRLGVFFYLIQQS